VVGFILVGLGGGADIPALVADCGNGARRRKRQAQRRGAGALVLGSVVVVADVLVMAPLDFGGAHCFRASGCGRAAVDFLRSRMKESECGVKAKARVRRCAATAGAVHARYLKSMVF